MNNAAPQGRFPVNSPWRNAVRMSGDLASRLVMNSKPGSTVLSIRPTAISRRVSSTYTDY